MLDSAHEMWGTFLHHWLVTAASSWPCGCTCRTQLESKFEILCSSGCLNLEFVGSVPLSFEVFVVFLLLFFLILEWVSLDCYLYSWIMLHVFCVSYRYLITPHHSTFFSKYTLILTGFDLWDGKIIYSTCSLGFLIPTEAFNKLCYCIELVKSSFFFLSSPGQI